MEYVIIVTCLLLIQYFFFGAMVGKARGTYNVPAPATTGDPMFERYARVHGNTMEQLVLFLPSMFMFAYIASPLYAAVAGVVFFIGRIMYYIGYIADPASRGKGFLVGFIATIFVLFGSLFHGVMALI